MKILNNTSCHILAHLHHWPTLQSLDNARLNKTSPQEIYMKAKETANKMRNPKKIKRDLLSLKKKKRVEVVVIEVKVKVVWEVEQKDLNKVIMYMTQK